jgi:hypothetical protein
VTAAHRDGHYSADLTGTTTERQPRNRYQALTGHRGEHMKLTDAQTIELSDGTIDYTDTSGDGPVLVLLRG